MSLLNLSLPTVAKYVCVGTVASSQSPRMRLKIATKAVKLRLPQQAEGNFRPSERSDCSCVLALVVLQPEVKCALYHEPL